MNILIGWKYIIIDMTDVNNLSQNMQVMTLDVFVIYITWSCHSDCMQWSVSSDWWCKDVIRIHCFRNYFCLHHQGLTSWPYIISIPTSEIVKSILCEYKWNLQPCICTNPWWRVQEQYGKFILTPSEHVRSYEKIHCILLQFVLEVKLWICLACISFSVLQNYHFKWNTWMSQFVCFVLCDFWNSFKIFDKYYAIIFMPEYLLEMKLWY
jgi:hypothetical protein